MKNRTSAHTFSTPTSQSAAAAAVRQGCTHSPPHASDVADHLALPSRARRQLSISRRHRTSEGFARHQRVPDAGTTAALHCTHNELQSSVVVQRALLTSLPLPFSSSSSSSGAPTPPPVSSPSTPHWDALAPLVRTGPTPTRLLVPYDYTMGRSRRDVQACLGPRPSPLAPCLAQLDGRTDVAPTHAQSPS